MRKCDDKMRQSQHVPRLESGRTLVSRESRASLGGRSSEDSRVERNERTIYYRSKWSASPATHQPQLRTVPELYSDCGLHHLQHEVGVCAQAGESTGVLDVWSRRDFADLTPRLARAHFSNFGPRGTFCKKVFGLGEKAWFGGFGRPRGALGHFSRLGAHLPLGAP